MSSPAPVSNNTAPAAVTITGPAASPFHPSHFQMLMAAIMAGLQAATPIVVNLVPPKVATGLEAGVVLEPTIVSVVQAVQTANQAE